MLVDPTEQIEDRAYHILIVDDSLADFELYQSFLKKDSVYQYVVHYAETAIDALEIFLTQALDLILVDFSLPDMDGLEFIESIQATDRNPDIPIIMLTGQGNEAIALNAMKHDICDYFVKGNLSFQQFLNAVHNVLVLIENQGQNGKADERTSILIVDDSEADLELYRRFLERDQERNYEISTVTTIHDALGILRTREFDVVLTDYRLPDSTGLDLIKNLFTFNKSLETAVVLITGQGNESLVVEAMKAGATDYLVKQLITPDSLRKTVGKALEYLYLSKKAKKEKFQQTLLFKITLEIRNYPKIEDILRFSTIAIQEYLQCDRVVICEVKSAEFGEVVGEFVKPPFAAMLGLKIADILFVDSPDEDNPVIDFRRQVFNNIDQATLKPGYRELLEQFDVKSLVSLPLLIETLANPLWGLIMVHFCQDRHVWEVSELKFLNEIATQVSMGIRQSLLIQQLEQERDRVSAIPPAPNDALVEMSHDIQAILGLGA